MRTRRMRAKLRSAATVSRIPARGAGHPVAQPHLAAVLAGPAAMDLLQHSCEGPGSSPQRARNPRTSPAYTTAKIDSRGEGPCRAAPRPHGRSRKRSRVLARAQMVHCRLRAGAWPPSRRRPSPARIRHRVRQILGPVRGLAAGQRWWLHFGPVARQAASQAASRRRSSRCRPTRAATASTTARAISRACPRGGTMTKRRRRVTVPAPRGTAGAARWPRVRQPRSPAVNRHPRQAHWAVFLHLITIAHRVQDLHGC